MSMEQTFHRPALPGLSWIRRVLTNTPCGCYDPCCGGIWMRWQDFRRSGNVEDRRGQGGFRVPGGRGGLGIGTVLLLGLIGYALGIDPRILIGGAEIFTRGGSTTQQAPAPSAERTG